VLLAGLVTLNNRRALLAIGSLLVLLQLAFLPSASWLLGARALPTLVRDGSAAVVRAFGPERIIAQQVRERMRDDDRVLVASHHFAAMAEFAGAAFVTNWYDTELQQLHAQAGGGMGGWQAVIERSGASLLLIRRDPLDPGLKQWIQERDARLLMTINDASLYRIEFPAQPGLPLETTAGSVSVRFAAPEPAQARLSAINITLECAHPFEPFAVGWALQRRQGDVAWVRHAWVSCPAGGQARVELGLSLPSEWGDLVFEARPVSAESQQVLTLLDHEQRNRRDLAAERNLSGEIRQVICRRWRMCRELARPAVLHAVE
jgi:hypothetical protein